MKFICLCTLKMYDLNKLAYQLNICESQIIQTRNQKLRSTASCRLWQFKYAVINYFLDTRKKINFNDGTRSQTVMKRTKRTQLTTLRKPRTQLTKVMKRTKRKPLTTVIKRTNRTQLATIHKRKQNNVSKRIIENMCMIIKNFLELNQTEYPELYNIVYLNIPIDTIKISSFNTIEELPINQNYYMCVYNQNNLGYGSIIHYFTIIRKKDTYYVNSSYGSDDVCVPQYTTKLETSEFTKLCVELPELTENSKDLYTKYFLIKNLSKRYNNNNIEANTRLKSKWISPKKGIEKEINSLGTGYCIGYINNYQKLVNEFIELNQ